MQDTSNAPRHCRWAFLLLLFAGASVLAADDPAFSPQPVAVNQVGFETDRPKRFTAPKAADGTPFSIRSVAGGEALFNGEVRGGIGDFSAYKPEDSNDRYLIELTGAAPAASDPFLVRSDLYREQFWQSAVDFLIDSRSAVGTHPSAFGGCPWRDGTYYDAIVPALTLFYLADPERIAAMPRQIDWEADKKRVTASDFKFDDRDPGAKGFMNSVRAYYDLEPPAADAPDVVKLIHWGAGLYLVNPLTHDPSKDPDKWKVHTQTVEQVAYVLWAWPVLKQWLPESFYQRARDFCFGHWKPSLAISP